MEAGHGRLYRCLVGRLAREGGDDDYSDECVAQLRRKQRLRAADWRLDPVLRKVGGEKGMCCGWVVGGGHRGECVVQLRGKQWAVDWRLDPLL